VPVGTVVSDIESGDIIADLAQHEQTALLRAMWQRWLGQYQFQIEHEPRAASVHARMPGESRRLRFELKGARRTRDCWDGPTPAKSTFIRAVSAARPKVADYPSRTLHPNLGVVRVDNNRSFVIADIPGLIEALPREPGLAINSCVILPGHACCHIVDIAPFRPRDDAVAEARAIVTEHKEI
jgi:GTP-binding protein